MAAVATIAVVAAMVAVLALAAVAAVVAAAAVSVSVSVSVCQSLSVFVSVFVLVPVSMSVFGPVSLRQDERSFGGILTPLHGSISAQCHFTQECNQNYDLVKTFE